MRCLTLQERNIKVSLLEDWNQIPKMKKLWLDMIRRVTSALEWDSNVPGIRDFVL
jgi:hypothetical protein